MLPIDGTAHSLDVLLEIAEGNENLADFRIVRFLAWSPPGSITQSESEREYFWFRALPTEAFKTRLLSLRDEHLGEKRTAIGFCSTARSKDGSILYIPQLDFSSPVSEDSLALIKQKFETIMGKATSGKVMPGYILASGESYHYIGLKLLAPEEWLEFMGLALLFEDRSDRNKFSPVDRRWIGHSLIRRHGALRLFGVEKTTGGIRPEPVVVGFIG
jgi:hypothetical protein